VKARERHLHQVGQQIRCDSGADGHSPDGRERLDTSCPDHCSPHYSTRSGPSGDTAILWREIIGNGFGIASAIGGMRRVVWAWPVGIVGNILLFTVFLGGVFHTPQDLDLYGQAGRQVMFLIVSGYGWWQWRRAKTAGLREPEQTDPSRSIVTEPADTYEAVQPHWATARERVFMLVVAVVGTCGFAWVFSALGSWGPWSDGLDLHRVAPRHARHGPRLDRILAHLDRRRPRRRPRCCSPPATTPAPSSTSSTRRS
jgi:nicotinamide riboside transporter PnuC